MGPSQGRRGFTASLFEDGMKIFWPPLNPKPYSPNPKNLSLALKPSSGSSGSTSSVLMGAAFCTFLGTRRGWGFGFWGLGFNACYLGGLGGLESGFA